MNSEEYQKFDAVGLAELIARREVNAHELLDVAMTRLHKINPIINGVTNILEDKARRSIDDGLPNGSLAGVPFLVKDILAQMEGVVTSAGSRLFKSTLSSVDSALVAAYRRTGLVLFGKTNTPEFGLNCSTEPVAFGPTLNPWDLGRSAGGSSGGAAAAVAAGIVPAAHGSDGGGSIRIPASCCGLFGFKPSRGRVSLAPVSGGTAWLGCEHAITRSVRDSALLLDVSCQPEAGDQIALPPPAMPFAEEVGRDPGKLRIAFTTDNLVYGTLDPECADAVRSAAALCELLGHHVDEDFPKADYASIVTALHKINSASVAATMQFEAIRRGKPISLDDVETSTMWVYQQGLAVTGVQLVSALAAFNAASRTIANFFQLYDVLLLSTLGELPVSQGWLDMNSTDPHFYCAPVFPKLEGCTERIYQFMPNTLPFNVTGQPAMTVPLAWSNEGLPIGIQFVGRAAMEATLFRLASQLEAARPWAHRRPAL